MAKKKNPQPENPKQEIFEDKFAPGSDDVSELLAENDERGQAIEYPSLISAGKNPHQTNPPKAPIFFVDRVEFCQNLKSILAALNEVFRENQNQIRRLKKETGITEIQYSKMSLFEDEEITISEFFQLQNFYNKIQAEKAKQLELFPNK